jgi:hypothetical protein
VTGLKERDGNVKALQNSETISRVANNCLIRTHSAENVTRNNSHCSKSNCNCSIDSFPSTQIQMHTADPEQYQKCLQTGCYERSKSADILSVKHFSAMKCMCGIHNNIKGQGCKGRNCLHYAHSWDNFSVFQHTVDEHQGLSSHPTLPESGCHGSLNDGKLHGVGNDEVFKKPDFKYTRQTELVRTVKGTSDGSSEHKIGADCGPLSPLSTLRLQPTRHCTKSAILSVLESGEVCIEFLRKKRGNREDRVADVCRISGDGLRVRNV